MAEYIPSEIEQKWQEFWKNKGLYTTKIDKTKPKFYALDMFPYPSGAGLHVGHPLGYIASDIVSRYKRLKGFNVLHPMGFDAFGLPAEQYAIETGQHPAITTEKNIATFKSQLGKIGFCYDWNREVRTSDPSYYKWTQWIFTQLYNCWFDTAAQRARYIDTLVAVFEEEGNELVSAACDEEVETFSAAQWKSFSAKEKEEKLSAYRLAYLSEAVVNWCPALGSVLAHDEVKDGLSERGGHPVERKKMWQWSLRISAYAERLLSGLEKIDWPEAIKEVQKNWIGKSEGAEIRFKIDGRQEEITVFTTRPDTIFGVTFLSVAPEHELVASLTTEVNKEDVDLYVAKAKKRSERERMMEAKTVSGEFTGSFAIHPFTQERIPIWVADYVLAGYGTGAVMGVPSSDDRDYRFAQHFGLDIRLVISGSENFENPTELKKGMMMNSGFLNGLDSDKAIKEAIRYAEGNGFGKGKIQYKIRDAIFARQRYWGEPVPVYFENGIPKLLSDKELPLILPEIDEYKPTETGEPPLGRAKDWKYKGQYSYELSTMPGWAGSSWYFLRYMDPQNAARFVGKEEEKYWNQVDLYIGGAEHATGHLLYARFWNMFLYDLDMVSSEEPFKKLINQGMIQGRSNFVYRVNDQNKFVSLGLKGKYSQVSELHVDVNIVDNDVLNIEAFKAWRPEYADYEFELENGKYVCGYAVEKMSKRWYNVVNPDDVIAKFGADTLRLYEMFLGPLEQSKPWNTHGIDGTYKFLKRLWRLFVDDANQLALSNEAAAPAELKILHQTIKKVGDDIERYSFNTSVSTFMIFVNEMYSLKCHKKEVLLPFLVVLSPFAPHITEELWHRAGGEGSILEQSFPLFKPEYLVESEFEYPVSVNGKLRGKLTLPLEMGEQAAKDAALASDFVQKWLEGKEPKKFVFVQGRIINIVI